MHNAFSWHHSLEMPREKQMPPPLALQQPRQEGHSWSHLFLPSAVMGRGKAHPCAETTCGSYIPVCNSSSLGLPRAVNKIMAPSVGTLLAAEPEPWLLSVDGTSAWPSGVLTHSSGLCAFSASLLLCLHFTDKEAEANPSGWSLASL